MSLIKAQEKFIAQVNACTERPNDRKNRVRRSASKKLRAYCKRIGMTDDQATPVVRDAWDMAELEFNAEE